MRMILKYCFFLILYILFCLKPSYSMKFSSVDIGGPYDSARFLYTMDMDDWASDRILNISPENYPQKGYDNMREFEITDTSLLQKLSQGINRRDVYPEYKGDFDTIFMVFLRSQNSSYVDTLAVDGNVIWFNGEVFNDKSLAKLLTETIMKCDNEWTEIVKEYYLNDEWDSTGNLIKELGL